MTRTCLLPLDIYFLYHPPASKLGSNSRICLLTLTVLLLVGSWLAKHIRRRLGQPQMEQSLQLHINGAIASPDGR